MAEVMWKSMRAGLTSQYDGSQWNLGEWRKMESVTELCKGFNCSPRVIDGMRYVCMEILAKVEVRGAIIKDDDKWTCSQMRVVEAWCWSKEESVRLAIFAAELVLGNYEKRYPKDNRPRKAIEMAKAWLESPTKDAAYAARAAAYAAYAADAAAAAADATLDKCEAYIQSRILHLKKYGEG